MRNTANIAHTNNNKTKQAREVKQEPGQRAEHTAKHAGPHLDARDGDNVAEAEVELAQELWEVVQQHQQHPQRTLGWEGGLLVFFFSLVCSVVPANEQISNHTIQTRTPK